MLVAAFLVFVTLNTITFINAYPYLLFATEKDIRIANVSKSTKSTVLVKNLEQSAAVDFYYEGGLVCWTEHGAEVIQCVSYNGTTSSTGNKVAVISSGLIAPDGLAIDWFTQKLYWTDGETNRIEVATLQGKHRKVLIWKDIDQPRAIALVPMKKFMFWTDWGEVPKIERVGMNGDPNTRRVIVSKDIFWPNGLAVDYVAETIYWLDGHLKFIASVDYEGKNRCTIAKEEVVYPYGLSMFQNKLYWTDWGTWSVYMLNKTKCNSDSSMKAVSNGKPVIPKELFHSDYVPMGIRVWDKEQQPRGDTPCHRNNGNCSHLCLLAPYPPWYTCACPTGVKLLDNFTCADGPQEMVLLAQRTHICRISLDSPDYTNFILPLQGVKHAIAIDFDPVEEYLYWTDDEARVIRRARLDGSGQEDIVTTEVEHPDGIAVDWIARNIYWTDTGTDRIEVARLTGASRKVLISDGLVEPRAIALAPQQGWMFWSDWNEKYPKIERASLDGTDRLTLVTTNLGWPNGIALDLKHEKIYWCDAKTDKIELVNMDGTDRRELISDNVPHIFGISLLGDYLYWTDWQRRSIERVRVTGEDREEIVDQLPNVMGLKAIRFGRYEGTNPCSYNNGGCSHLCLNRPKNNYICACQIGYELSVDGQTCVIPEAFLLFSRKENIGRISIENGNNDVTIPVAGVREASALDFDITDNRIYWSDVKLKAITRAFMNGSDVERIVEFGLESPEGVAVDWVAHNIYWTDTGSKRIEVARLGGSSRKVLLWTKIVDPRSLALDPSEGYMYWSDWGEMGSIERAAMDGSQRVVLIGRLGRANGLTIDYTSRRIYWTTADFPAIECADLDGSNRKAIISEGIQKPYSLTQYQDFLCWTEWEKGTIECANKSNGSNRTRIHEHLDSVTDILVFHNSRQVGWNQCAVSNGGCSHLCLAVPNSGAKQSPSHRCACPTHYTLAHNNETCLAPLSFLLYSQKNSISRLLLDTSDCPDITLPIQALKNVKAVEFDPVSQYLFWIDGRTQSIKRSYDNGTLTAPFVPGANHYHPYDLAVDPFSRLLYWTCAVTDSINVTRIDNNSAVGAVFKAKGEKPRNIALHPEKGLMFWTDLGSKLRIMRARMDGQKHVEIISDLEHFVTFTVDRIDDLLFWSHWKKIEMSDLNGENRKVVVKTQVIQESSLAVHGDYVYWIDKDQQQIERVNKLTGENRQIVLPRVAHLTDLIAVHFPSRQAYISHGCSEENRRGDCSHICHASPTNSSTNSVRCSCPIDLVLHEDRRTCGAQPVCDQDHFTCTSPSTSPSDCIPGAWRCDGQSDCPDGSDEKGCPDCKPDQFKCQSGPCIDIAYVCDGTPQCPDSFDEFRCCKEPGQFMCLDSSVCIPESDVCNGFPNCEDESDETPVACSNAGANKHHTEPESDSNKSTYVMGILLAVSVVVTMSLIVYCCHRRMSKTADDTLDDELNDHARDPLSPKSAQGIPKPCPIASIQKNGRVNKTGIRPNIDAVRMSTLNGSTTSNSYDRSHITGASSSTTESGPAVMPLLVSSSSLLYYPRETANPPPSPATTTSSNRRLYQAHNRDCCPTSSSVPPSHRPYRHYRVINQPPPPTPCSTDVCDESDSNYPLPPHMRCRYYSSPGSEYDSDPSPPPPTPRSHCLSDIGGYNIPLSCPPSPSSTAGGSSTCYNPLPPPPSPDHSPQNIMLNNVAYNNFNLLQCLNEPGNNSH